MGKQIPEGLAFKPRHLEMRERLVDVNNRTRFKAITDVMTEIYTKKNRDYGNSFDESLDEDGLLVSKIRLGDKFKRFSQLISNPSQVKDESVRDTLLDAANIAIMTIMWMDLQEEKQSSLVLSSQGLSKGSLENLTEEWSKESGKVCVDVKDEPKIRRLGDDQNA